MPNLSSRQDGKHTTGKHEVSYTGKIPYNAFCGEVFDLMHFLSFPRKLLQLPVTLPISGILYSNIHGKLTH